jgi:hypothetical protein
MHTNCRLILEHIEPITHLIQDLLDAEPPVPELVTVLTERQRL